MTFNVENLFDNEDDPGKADHTYFSIEDKQSDEHKAACARIDRERWRRQCLYWDWNDAIVDRKLSAIADVILQVNDGDGADIIALQEVENASILERLRSDYLAGAGYLAPVLIEGNDLRGIDVAFLSKLPVSSKPTLHAIEFDDSFGSRAADTRGILQADFVLPDGETLTGFAVHFPAPFHPTAMRVAAYGELKRLKSVLPEGRPAFAAGDFNTTSSEDGREKLLDRFARPDWIVAHDHCRGDCRGTQYYGPDDSWSFLDMILWSAGSERSENTTWQLRAGSVHIANESAAQVSRKGTPARFTLPEGRGVSDHWPLVIAIESKSIQ